MSGISEALIATAIGILVAIPAVVAFNIFQKKSNDIEENSAALANQVLAVMKSTKSQKNSFKASSSAPLEDLADSKRSLRPAEVNG
jgi:biopolymer transport protein ExbB/biopolymer transport protein TolQ